MLKKVITFDHQITEDGQIQVRQITRITEDGTELAKTYHRHVVKSGDDITNEDERTKKIAQVIHVKEIK